MNAHSGAPENALPPWQCLARLYQTCAVIALNTIIFLILALLAANAILTRPLTDDQKAELTAAEANSIGVNYRYSQTMRLHAHYYSDAAAVTQMAHEFDLFASQGHWQVHPWGGLTMRPFSGEQLNINRDGYRITPPPNPAYDGQPPLIVWAFGGSTTFGQSIPDAYTLAAQLQVILQERLPQHQVQVWNFGIPWYFSSQEVALFAEHLRRQPAPHVATFLDGLNDLYAIGGGSQTPLVPRLTAAWEAQVAEFTHPEDKPWVTLNYAFPPSRLAHQWGLVEANPPSLFSYDYALADNPYRTDPMQYGVDQYLKNLRMAAALGAEFDVATAFFLQPLPFWDDYPDFLAFQAGVRAGHTPATFYDLTRIFDTADPAYELLADPTHYSDYATRLLAERMADLILENEPF